VVTSTLVPGAYERCTGTLKPNGPSRNDPAPRSSTMPNTLGASKRGTHSQSIAPSGATSAPVWQSERNAYSAIGGNGDGAAALWGCSAACGVAPSRVTPVAIGGSPSRSHGSGFGADAARLVAAGHHLIGV